ncbi:MAG TPA: thymidine phosphorylase [Vicinamibacterales bacterium]|jgi:pyrimidine-nucleoside phosphorylase|nr:thymidine phosphorylase [Vicinamibacterales bacterium]
MRAVDLIRQKRDGGALDDAAIDFFIAGVTDGTLPDYQASALLMAIVLRGMSPEETAALTEAMVRSGIRVEYPAIGGTPVDKHSTGGVGDKTSLILAPLAAACGAYVPMMSGRGLGHTGGTLDKLEAIPGFRTGLSLPELRRALSQVGCAMIGQTEEIAPADKKLYALRDVTGTVESIPLICASIMSKKIAEGIGGLVLDVKTGSGAFMKTLPDSRRLAQSLVAIGVASGVRTEALITNMDAPLGRMVGNSLEVVECIETLKGHGPRDVEELSVLLAARMLIVAGLEQDESAAVTRVRASLASGAGVEKLKEIIQFQGGDPRVVDRYDLLPSVPERHDVVAKEDGHISALLAEEIGRAAVMLGAGRGKLDDVIDPGVGIEIVAHVGDPVRRGEPVLRVHHHANRGLSDALPLLDRAVQITDTPPLPRPVVVERVGED